MEGSPYREAPKKSLEQEIESFNSDIRGIENDLVHAETVAQLMSIYKKLMNQGWRFLDVEVMGDTFMCLSVKIKIEHQNPKIENHLFISKDMHINGEPDLCQGLRRLFNPFSRQANNLDWKLAKDPPFFGKNKHQNHLLELRATESLGDDFLKECKPIYSECILGDIFERLFREAHYDSADLQNILKFNVQRSAHMERSYVAISKKLEELKMSVGDSLDEENYQSLAHEIKEDFRKARLHAQKSKESLEWYIRRDAQRKAYEGEHDKN